MADKDNDPQAEDFERGTITRTKDPTEATTTAVDFEQALDNARKDNREALDALAEGPKSGSYLQDMLDEEHDFEPATVISLDISTAEAGALSRVIKAFVRDHSFDGTKMSPFLTDMEAIAFRIDNELAG